MDMTVHGAERWFHRPAAYLRPADEPAELCTVRTGVSALEVILEGTRSACGVGRRPTRATGVEPPTTPSREG